MVEELEMNKKQTKNNKKKATHSFNTYIHKVLKVVHPECQISANAIGQLDELVKILAKKIVESARTACTHSRKSTIGSEEIKLAVKNFFPTELGDQTCEEINKACEEFDKNRRKTTEKSEKNERSKPVRREMQAGIQFAVSLCEKFIRDFGTFGLNVTKDASVALAAALEYVTSEILDLAGNVAIENKKKIVIIRYIYLGVHNNPELDRMFSDLKIEFLGGGVVPSVRKELQTSKEKKKEQAARRRKNAKGKEKNDVKKPHKFLPGTKALMDINKFQKLPKYSTELLLQKLPFGRAVRTIVEEINEKESDIKSVHFANGTITALQTFVETRVVNLYKESVDFAIHAKRDGITQADVKLAWVKTQSFVSYQEENSVDDKDIGNNGLDRLCYRAGVKRKGNGIHSEVRKFIHSLLTSILSKTLNYVKYRKVITIGLSDLKESFCSLGINVTVPKTIGKPKTTKKNPEKDVLKEDLDVDN